MSVNVKDYSAAVYLHIDKTMRKRVSEACRLVKKDAKMLAPKGTRATKYSVPGDLRRSIKMNVRKLAGLVYSKLFYSRFVEFGTAASGGKAASISTKGKVRQARGVHHATREHSYLRHALTLNRSKIKDILTKKM